MKPERYPLEYFQSIPPRTARLLFEGLHGMHDIYDKLECIPREELTVEDVVSMIDDMHDNFIDVMLGRLNGTQPGLFKYLSKLSKQRGKESDDRYKRIIEELRQRTGIEQVEGEIIYQYADRLREAVDERRKGLSRETKEWLKGWDENRAFYARRAEEELKTE